MLGVGLATVGAEARAATPTYYANQAVFQADITNAVVDDYSNPGYVFNQDNATMSAVLGETEYMSTGHGNLNLISNMPAQPYYCAGCNGSFELSFQSTSVGNAIGVAGVGFRVQTHSLSVPYFAFITYADGTTDNVAIPAAGEFWGVTAPERIERIHIGLSGGGTTTSGSFGIDDLIVGGFCSVAGQCPAGPNQCVVAACDAGVCALANSTDSCDDGSMCTENDTCAAGACTGTPIVCDDGNECTTDLCAPETGCVVQLTTDPCDDGDACTDMDACSNGSCVGQAIACDDQDVCTIDACDADLGCISEPDPGCCTSDGDCAADEICDMASNDCVPDGGVTSAGGDGSGDATAGDDGTPPPGDGTGGGGGDAADADGGGGSTGGDAGGAPLTDGVPDDGVVPGGCGCRSRNDAGTAWWLVPALAWARRRRRREAL